jgi:hypothetical protein
MSTAKIAARKLLQIFVIDDESSSESSSESSQQFNVKIIDNASPSHSQSPSQSPVSSQKGQQQPQKESSHFGELYEPNVIVDSLLRTVTNENENNNEIDSSGIDEGEENSMAMMTGHDVIIRSQPYHCTPYLDLMQNNKKGPTTKEWHEIPLQVRNSLSFTTTTTTNNNNNNKGNHNNSIIRIRWVDTNYQTKQSYTWDISPAGCHHHHPDDNNNNSNSSNNNNSDNGRINDNDTTTTTTTITKRNDNLYNNTLIQYCKPGDFFLFSLLLATAEMQEEKQSAIYKEKEEFDDVSHREILLGAYRPLRPLPSGSNHSIVIGEGRDDRSKDHNEEKERTTSTATAMKICNSHSYYYIENVLTDPFDVCVTAAAVLDPANNNSDDIISSTSNNRTTIELLNTILSNIIRHPYEEKYHRLRISNSKIQRYLISSWAAMQFLTVACGFEQQQQQQYMEEERDNDDDDTNVDDWLVAPTSSPSMMISAEEIVALHEIRTQALELLQILLDRTQSTFIQELAQPTPWTPSICITTASSSSSDSAVDDDGGRNRTWGDPNRQRRGFISDEEKWNRADRNAKNRRNGRGRRPNPGEAPSSKGKWGR